MDLGPGAAVARDLCHSLTGPGAFRHPLGPATEDVGDAWPNMGIVRKPFAITTTIWLLTPS
jgi:hypothetical protein